MKVKSLGRVRLSATPWTAAYQSIHAIFQTRVLEWGAIAFSDSLSHLCSNQEAQAYAEDNSLLFMETSAKTAMNVNEIFMAIGKLPLFPSPSQGVLLACCLWGLWGPFINRSFTIFNILIKFSFSSLR